MKLVIGIILFPLMCLLLSFFVLITDISFTYLLLDNPEAIQPTKQLMQYFFGKAEVPAVFSPDEREHLADVKQLISYAYYVLEILIIIVAYCMLENWRKIIKWGSALLVLLLLLAFLMPFDNFFTHFHEIFFPQGNWMFAADSTMIMFYPTAFFMNYGIAIAVHALIVAGTFIIVSRRG